MSSSKSDRSIAPPGRATRASRAKETRDRNITVPEHKLRSVKPKKGERVMAAQLATNKPAPPVIIDVESPPERDVWWTAERDKAYEYTLSGFTQSAIARELGRDRHTIKIWQEDERFADRLADENVDRFRASRQRRTIQTLRLTDKAHGLAEKMLEQADRNPKDLNSRLAARDWLSEFREQSRREDEIYGLDKQRVDVNVSGSVAHQHNHKGTVNLSFKEFLVTSMNKLGVDVETEEVDAERADDALAAIAERALMEGSFLDEMVDREKKEKLAISAAGKR